MGSARSRNPRYRRRGEDILNPRLAHQKRARTWATPSCANLGHPFALLAVLYPDHKLQAGPHVIDRADFHVHQSRRQPDIAHAILIQIACHS